MSRAVVYPCGFCTCQQCGAQRGDCSGQEQGTGPGAGTGCFGTGRGPSPSPQVLQVREPSLRWAEGRGHYCCLLSGRLPGVGGIRAELCRQEGLGLSRKTIRTKHIRGNSEFHFLLVNERLYLLKKASFIFSLQRSHTLISTFI